MWTSTTIARRILKHRVHRPVADGATDEARRVNRRIDVRFLSRGPDAAALAELLETLETSFVPR